MTRNSRMPDSLAADLDAECSACLMGSRRLAELFARYGRDTVEACFDAHRRQDHRDLPARDPVEDPRRQLRLGGLRRARRRRRAAAARPADHPDDGLDSRGAAGPGLHRHLPPGQGPDQPLRRLRRRQLPQEVAGADPAQPRRHPGADGRARRQRGRRAADRDALPAARHAADAGLPRPDERPHLRHPAAARRARRGAGQGGRRPDAGRPGDHPLHRRLRHRPRRRAVPDARGARRRLRRPVVRRRRGHHPRRARLAEPADRVHRVALPVPRRAARPRRRLRRRRGCTAAGWATRSTSGCCATRTSCRSPTARSSPAGGSRAAGPAGRSR